MMGSFSKIAGGNIGCSRIVTLQSNGSVIECDGTTAPWGISQPSTRHLAITGWDDGYCAISGEMLNIYGPGDDEAPLELGGTVALGGYIKATTGGKGIAATSDKDFVIAQAHKMAGVSGDIIKVKPVRFDKAV